jgi:hypothetical protein
MSDEAKQVESQSSEVVKKRPYNLREKKEKKAAYRSLIRAELGGGVFCWDF